MNYACFPFNIKYRKYIPPATVINTLIGIEYTNTLSTINCPPISAITPINAAPAMVIAQDTEYVLLDEPTNNLDIYHASNLMKIVRRLCDELGKTVILVLHEINYAAFYSDYICAFKDGKIASFGTVEEVITKENLSSIYNVEFEIMQIKGKPLSIYY